MEMLPPPRSGLSSPSGLSWPAGTDAEALGPGRANPRAGGAGRGSNSRGVPPWRSGLSWPAGTDAEALGAGRGSGRGSNGRGRAIMAGRRWLGVGSQVCGRRALLSRGVPVEVPTRGRVVPVERTRGRVVPVEVPTSRGRVVPVEVPTRGAGGAGRAKSRAGGWWWQRRERRAVCLMSVPITVRPQAAAGCAGPLLSTLRRRKEKRDDISIVYRRATIGGNKYDANK